MATDLTGLKVKDTYNSLLKIGDNSSLSATPDRISDGLGNESALWLSTARVGIGSTPDSNYTLTVSNNIKTQSLDASSSITASSLRLTGGSGTQGLMSWNTDEETIDVVQNGAVLQLGQETHVHVKNQSGATINDGTPVYVTGTLGSSGRLTVAPMIADGSIEAKYFLGVTTEDIPNGEDGKVTTFGKIRGLDTTAYTEGQTLYVSASTAGYWQTTPPAAPALDLEAAIVINVSANNGTIFVRAQQGQYLGMLHDVYLNSPTNNQFLVYNSTTSRWENQGIASVGSINLDSVTDNGNTTTNNISVGDVTAGNMTLSGYLRGAANFVIDPAAHGDETGVVQILGDLRVDGTTTTINSTTVTIDDKNIVLASGSATAADANGAGITIDGASATMTYNSTSDRFVFNKNIETNLVGNVTGNVTGNLTGDVTGNVTGDLTGNADTASALATARNIAVDGAVTGNADFDGSANITITTTVNHNHDADYVNVTGDTMTGNLNFSDTGEGITWTMNTDGASIKFYNTGDADTDSRLEFQTTDNNNEYFRWTHKPSGLATYELMRLTGNGSGGTLDIAGALDINGSTVIDSSRALDVTSATVKGLLNLTTVGAELQVGGVEVIDASRNITAASLTTDSITGGTIDINGTTRINLQYNGTTKAFVDSTGFNISGGLALTGVDGISLTDEDSTTDSYFHANVDYTALYTVTSNARYGADYIQVDGLDSRSNTRFTISPKDISSPDPYAYLYIGGNNSNTAPNTLVDWHTIYMNALSVRINNNEVATQSWVSTNYTLDLDDVTTNGNSTTNSITVDNLTTIGNINVGAALGLSDDNALHLRGITDPTHKIYYRSGANVWDYNVPIKFEYYNSGTPVTRFTLNESGDLNITGALTALGNVSALGGSFTDPVTIYDSSAVENPRLSVGRDANQNIRFYLDDRIARITHLNDETSGDHTFEFTIDSPSGADKKFQWYERLADGTGAVELMALNSDGLNVSGSTTASSFIKSGGTSSQFLKADGSVDSNTYLTSESDTFATVTARGNTTGESIKIGTTVAPNEKLEVNGSVFVNQENAGFIVDASGDKRVGLMKYSGHEGVISRVSGQDFGIVRVGGSNIKDVTGLVYDIYVGGTGDTSINNNLFVGQALDNANYLHLTENQLFRTGGDLYLQWSGGSNIIMANSGKNVGIGISSPSARLDIASNAGANDEKLQRWTYYAPDPTAFYLELKQTVTAGVVAYNFSMVNASTAYNDVLVLDRGKVGIGTTSPAAKLSVYDEDGNDSMLQVRNYATSATGNFTGNYMVELRSAYATGSTGGALLVHTQESSDSRPTMQVSDANGIFTTFVNGKVGIGDTSPTVAKTSIVSSDSSVPTLRISNEASGGSGFVFQRWAYIRNTDAYRLDLVQEVSSGLVQYRFDLTNNNTTYNSNLVLDRGNVGIGTSSPDHKLQVNGGTSNVVAHFQSTDSIGGIKLSDSTGNVELTTSGTNGLDVRPAGGNALFRITGNGSGYLSSGFFGIGNTSASMRLHISESGANISSNEAVFGSSMKGIMIQNTNNDNSSNGIWFATNGVHWAGITGQRDNYTSTWGTDLRFYTHDASTTNLTSSYEVARMTSGGALHVKNDIVAFSTTTSDARLKDDVKTIDNALDKVLSLRGVEYVWNKGSRKGQKDLGVIAQEVEQVLPELVKEHRLPLVEDSETEYKTVDYEKMVGVLIEAIKEQQKQIDELKARLDA